VKLLLLLWSVYFGKKLPDRAIGLILHMQLNLLLFAKLSGRGDFSQAGICITGRPVFCGKFGTDH
jgi:hypothetical protein